MEESERQKVIQLLKEMRSESDAKDIKSNNEGNRLSWMYKGPSDLLDKEEYLLGKAIDKSFEVLNNPTGSDACLGRTGEHSNIPKKVLEKTECTEQVDIAKKILEDPLYAIKQKEMEARRKILNNPVKLKQIKQMLLERSQKALAYNKQRKKKLKKEKLTPGELNILLLKYLKKFSEKEKRKALQKIIKPKFEGSSSKRSSNEYRKEKKKKNFKRKFQSSSSDSDSNSESSGSFEEDKKSVKVKKEKKVTLSCNDKGRKSKKESSSDIDSESRKKHRSSSKKHSFRSNSKHSIKSSATSDSYSSSTQSSSSSSCSSSSDESKNDNERKSKKPSISKSRKDEEDSNKRKNNSYKKAKYKEERKKTFKYDCDKNNSNRDRKAKSYGLMMPDGTKPVSKERVIPTKKYEKINEIKTKYVPPTIAKPLSEKEREAKLKEMMEDAKTRKADREKNLANHRKKEAKEEDSRTYDDDFMRRQISHLTSQESMADRIKSNLNNIQRSKSSMNGSFMKK